MTLLAHRANERLTLFKLTPIKQVASLTGQCPDYAHSRASSVFSSKDINRTVILTRQDFLPNHTADGDLLFTSNILDFQRSLSPLLNFGSRNKGSSGFYRWQGRLVTRKSPVPLALKTAFLMGKSCQRSIVPSPVIVL